MKRALEGGSILFSFKTRAAMKKTAVILGWSFFLSFALLAKAGVPLSKPENKLAQAKQETAKKDDRGDKLGEPAFVIPLTSGDLPAYPITQLQSPFLSVDQFVLDISERMRDLTKQHDSEMCAKICKNETTIGIVVTTILSHTACPVAEICPTGMDATPWDVHSHVDQPTYMASATDVLFLRGQKENTPQKADPNFFSQGDLATPNGYLVGKDVVLKQDGKTVSIVRPLLLDSVAKNTSIKK